eukprot:8871148-Alexandrium_andersonii.AAC.1
MIGKVALKVQARPLVHTLRELSDQKHVVQKNHIFVLREQSSWILTGWATAPRTSLAGASGASGSSGASGFSGEATAPSEPPDWRLRCAGGAS